MHRRVFPTWIQGSPVVVGAAITNVDNNSGATFSDVNSSLDLGIDALPRTPGKVWAAEILKVNWCVLDRTNPTFQSDAAFLNCKKYGIDVALSTSNSPQIQTFMNNSANWGIVNMWRVDQFIDIFHYGVIRTGATDVGVEVTPMDDSVVQASHDLTDLSGTGVLCFTNTLYLCQQSFINATAANTYMQAGNLFVIPEVFYRYVQVPLEYYLSKQEDLAHSGI